MNILGAFSGYSSNDIQGCIAFYRNVIGLEVSESMGGFNFEANGQKVFVYPKDDHRPATFTVLNFVVPNINDAIDELAAKGVTFLRYDNMPGDQDERGVMRGKDAGMGPNIAWFKDPSENILALIEE